MYRNVLKRAFDLVVAPILIMLFLPIMLSIALVLAVVNRGSPFFVQERPGLNEEVFLIVKFKTMADLRDNTGNLLPDDQRLTAIGRFVRKTSMDELPQLFNVLLGKMSLVGPRPLLLSYLSLYTPNQRKRHQVRPGITGWAQVNGRNAISWKRKFELDEWYVDHVSFLLDLRILAITLTNVLKSRDISKPGMATTEPFNGKN